MKTKINVFFILFLVPLFATAQAGFKESKMEKVEQTIETFKSVQPTLQSLFLTILMGM